MISREILIEQLMTILAADLPGFQAQSDMIPEGRIQLPEAEELTKAAVLIALFPRAGEWWLPLIRRVVDDYAHSGQVGLPGGRAEQGENAKETALREAWEEVGIPPEAVRVCGRLSTLPIPVSQFKVAPVIGVLTTEPEWVIEDREVDELLLIKVSDLMDPTCIQAEQRIMGGKRWTIPYFALAEHKVWGATAMILSEFRTILDKFWTADAG